METTPEVECTDPIERVEDSLNAIIPDNPNKPYDIKQVIASIVDHGEFLEIAPMYAKSSCFRHNSH